MIEHLRHGYITQIEGVRVCHHRGAPKHSIRFVPAQGNMVQTSSTHIRHLIESCPSGTLQERLQSVVMHPEILVQMILALRARGEISTW